jgi:predicted RNA methylase
MAHWVYLLSAGTGLFGLAAVMTSASRVVGSGTGRSA